MDEVYAVKVAYMFLNSNMEGNQRLAFSSRKNPLIFSSDWIIANF